MDDLRSRLVSLVHGDLKAVEISDDQEEALNALPVDLVGPLLKEEFDRAGDPSARSRLFDAMLRLNGFDRVRFLLELYETNERWRMPCCEALGQFPDRRAVDKLCSILLTETDPDLRYVAAESLAIVGDDTALEALDHAAAHDRGEDYEGFPVSEMAADAASQVRARIRAGEASRGGTGR
jgi:HEAT repeat protein